MIHIYLKREKNHDNCKYRSGDECSSIHFHWKGHDNTNERQMVSRSHYALPVSTTLLGRWYYVNAVPTRLALRQSGSYYVANTLRVLIKALT